jgi:5-hydroxyisourate hydrolase
MAMATLSTHVLDTVLGRPATGLPVRLDAAAPTGWRALADARTDRDGRVREAFAGVDLTVTHPGAAADGRYRLVFDTADYFARSGVTDYFYPQVAVCFAVTDAAAHYHVPLLLSPYAYSTYRGS